jgi:hypothetical protein
MRAILVCALVACAAPHDEAPPAPAAGPTYYRDVAPALARNCVTCHRDGGSAPFSLTTYDMAAEMSEAIVHVTAERTMPPWPADSSGACRTYVGQRWLDDATLALFAAWHAAGAPAGDPDSAIVVEPPPSTPFTPSVTLAASAPYQVGSGPDEYRCFVVDPGIAGDRFITALRVELDQAPIVHHIQLYASDDTDTDTALDAHEADEDRPGYS